MISTDQPSSATRIVRWDRRRRARIALYSPSNAHSACTRSAALAQPRGAAEVGQVDDEAAADHLAARLLDQLDARERGAAGGDQVVDHEHALAAVDRVGVDLDAVGAVLERRSRRRSSCAGSLPALRTATKPGLERHRDRAAEDEAARLDAGDLVDADALEGAASCCTARAEPDRILEQRGDVAELDARLRVVGDRADEGLRSSSAVRLIRRTSAVYAPRRAP